MLRVSRILVFGFLSGCAVQLGCAQGALSTNSTPNLELDANVTAEAVAVSAVYRTPQISCGDILIDNLPGRILDLPARLAQGQERIQLPINGLCMLKFTNVDNQRPLQIRLPASVKNFTFLPDESWTTTGATVGPGQSVDVPIIISRLEPFEFTVESQLMAQNFSIHQTLVVGE